MHLLYKSKRVVKLGLRSITEHKLRSFLTALGIIFGVGSVIAMLAIGEGASYEARQQIRELGSDNIIIRSVKPTNSDSSSGEGRRSRISEYGLKYEDLMRIHDLYPEIEIRVPAREITAWLRHGVEMVPGKVVGTVPWALRHSPIQLLAGRFIDASDMARNENVAVLGSATAARLFRLEHPLGQSIYLGKQAYQVVGIVRSQSAPSGGAGKGRKGGKGVGGAPPKEIFEVYVPITAAQRRFGEKIVNREAGSWSIEPVELHQLTLTAPSEAQVLPIASAVRATLRQTHRKADFEIVVPLELLKQAEQTKRIFNIVLGSIAAISLLVGGIGIMNIMLASVTERTREIGIRRALGATRGDIVVQFLTEALLLSLIGGLIGIGLGIGVPKLVTHMAGLVTIIQADSIVLAFSISLATGVLFGIYPAIRAAALSPIEALRHE